jgi:hypothetical protein
VADALVMAEATLERPDDLLAEYEQRRRAATLRSLALSRGAARVFSLPRPALHLGLLILPWAARWLNRHPKAFWRALRTAAESFRERPRPKAAATGDYATPRELEVPFR